MKKSITVMIGLCTCMLMLTGCTIATPIGTLTMTYDADAKSDKVVYTDDTGKQQEFDTENINGTIDDMLDDVDLPQGATTEDLKNFVHDGMETTGVNSMLDDIQGTLNSDMQNAESNSEKPESNE